MANEHPGALITGGTGALGQWVVRAFLDRGHRVHVTWIDEDELEPLKEFLGDDYERVQLHDVDLTEAEDVEELFEEIEEAGGVKTLVNVAGGFAYGSIEETDAETWQRMLELNATTCFLCSRAAAAALKERGESGHIVNVAAVPALDGGAAHMSAYSASKAAVLNLTQSFSDELVEDGITVNAIVPTTIDTPANREAMADADRSTWLPPEEIAEVIAFLTSEKARIVTGAAVTLSLG